MEDPRKFGNHVTVRSNGSAINLFKGFLRKIFAIFVNS